MMDKPTIIGDAVKSYSSICPNKPTIVFVPSLKMAEHVQTQYRAAGYQAAMVDGSMHDNERKGRLLALGNGGLHILISCQLIDEGVDVPIVEGIQLLSPTMSLGRFLQRAGRGARMFKGKDGYFLLDHVCNTFYPNMTVNHGDPAWNREWSLEGEPKKKKQPQEAGKPFSQCLTCYRVHAKAPVCPYCGYRYETNGRSPEQVDGQLEAMDPAVLARLSEIEKSRAMYARMNEEKACKTYQDFSELAKKRGYSPSWAGIRWAAKKKRMAPALPGI
jgi:superfamily II DNA or RNA helicase